jgi:putative aminopeptidase FrvX
MLATSSIGRISAPLAPIEHPDVGVYVTGTVQEEVDSRDVRTAAFNVAARTAIAVDMGVAQDYPWSKSEQE